MHDQSNNPALLRLLLCTVDDWTLRCRRGGTSVKSRRPLSPHSINVCRSGAGAAAHDPPVRELSSVANCARQLLPVQVGFSNPGGWLEEATGTLCMFAVRAIRCTPSVFARRAACGTNVLPACLKWVGVQKHACIMQSPCCRELGAELECITCDRCAGLWSNLGSWLYFHDRRPLLCSVFLFWRQNKSVFAKDVDILQLPSSKLLACRPAASASNCPQAVPHAVPALPRRLRRRAAGRWLDLPLLRRRAACERGQQQFTIAWARRKFGGLSARKIACTKRRSACRPTQHHLLARHCCSCCRLETSGRRRRRAGRGQRWSAWGSRQVSGSVVLYCLALC